MGKGRFLNQKLGKRMSRKFDLLKSHLGSRRSLAPSGTGRSANRQDSPNLRLPKKGISREEKTHPRA